MNQEVYSGKAFMLSAKKLASSVGIAEASDDAHLPADAKGKTVTTEPTHVRFLNPSTLATPPGYTQVVEITHGRTIYIAGQVALDQAGEVVGPHDFHAQTQQVFENLKAALTAVATDFTAVVKLNIYVVDISQLHILREVRERYVNTSSPPASTLVEVRRLAREEFLIEIEAVAYVPE